MVNTLDILRLKMWKKIPPPQKNDQVTIKNITFSCDLLKITFWIFPTARWTTCSRTEQKWLKNEKKARDFYHTFNFTFFIWYYLDILIANFSFCSDNTNPLVNYTYIISLAKQNILFYRGLFRTAGRASLDILLTKGELGEGEGGIDCRRGEEGRDFRSWEDVLKCLTGEGGQEGLPLEGREEVALGGREKVALWGREGVALGGREGVALGGWEGVALGGREGVALGGRERVALGGRDECGVGGIDFSLFSTVVGRDVLELLRSVLCPVISCFQLARIFS